MQHLAPPQNLEAERRTLCGCLLDNSKIDDVAEILSAEDFYRDAHQLYWRAMVWMRNQGQPVDAVTLPDVLTRFKQYEKTGGDQTLEEVMLSSPHAANTAYHAEIVREKSVARRLLQTAQEIVGDILEAQETSATVLAKAEAKIFAISEDKLEDSAISLGEMLGRAKHLIDRRKEGEIEGVMTGFGKLDSMTGGFRAGQLIIVAARPGQGKTALAMQIAIAAGGLNTSLVFSMEMSHEELGLRTLATLAEVNSKIFDDPAGVIFSGNTNGRPMPRLTEMEERKIIAAVGEGSKRNVIIDDRASRTITQIAARARRTKRAGGLGIVIVDYLSLMGGGKLKGESRQEEVARNSTALKSLAKDLGVPVVVLAQLNRKNEERTDKRPMLSDLRESGQIEQDADIVLLLHRPEYYDPNDQPGTADVIVAKNRNGPTGTVPLVFRREFTKFIDGEGYAHDSY